MPEFASTTQFDFLDAATNVATVLRLRLPQCQSGTFPALALQRLRFAARGVNRRGRRCTAPVAMCFASQLPDNSASRVSASLPLPVGFQTMDEEVLYRPALALLQVVLPFRRNSGF